LTEVPIVDRRLAQPDVVPTLKTTKVGIGLGLDAGRLVNLGNIVLNPKKKFENYIILRLVKM
jgi:hypothetical protein